MIDMVSIIWPDGSAATNWSLTEELQDPRRHTGVYIAGKAVLSHPVALTAVYGPSAEKLWVTTITRRGDSYEARTLDSSGDEYDHATGLSWIEAVNSLLVDVDECLAVEEAV